METNPINDPQAAKLDFIRQALNDTIVITYCKNFAQVVRQSQQRKPLSIEPVCEVVAGRLFSTNRDNLAVLSQSSCDEVKKMVQEGYTVTGYWQLSDGFEFTPLKGEVEAAVAKKVNDFARRVAFPEATAN